ncbi:antirestriction protein [Yersinia ruckeri]|uniref:antirestriction protein n=1 Tax=Yersinia ruckeri TaxID=29486 RepID=UPI0028F442F2|nr:antirestriction protein [Yersinia ruckeri]
MCFTASILNSSVNVLTDINTPSLGLHYEAKKCLRNPGLFILLVHPIWNFYTFSNGGAIIAPDSDETWPLFNAFNGNGAELSSEAAGIDREPYSEAATETGSDFPDVCRITGKYAAFRRVKSTSATSGDRPPC